MKLLSKLMLLAVVVMAGVSCSSDDDVSTVPPMQPDNLVVTAEAAGLTTLLSAVDAVENLEETLLDADAITVFAPTNEAFGDALQRFEADNLNQLVMALGGVENLEIVLGFHVVPAVAFADDLSDGEQTFTTLGNEQEITVTKSGSGVTVTDSEGTVRNVTMADVEIANGVVHVIDGVLIPELELPSEEEEPQDLVTTAEAAGLTTLVSAVQAVPELDQTLLNAEAITVFAPNNDAFQAALTANGAENLEELVEAIGGVENLETILGFHVVPAVAFSDDLNNGPNTFTTLAEQDIVVTKTSEGVTVTDFEGNVSNVIMADVAIENGVVHVIDAVLMPELPEVLPNLVEAATEAGLTTLLAAVEAVEDLDETLLGLDAITVFAPDNDAFADALQTFGAENLEELVAAIGGVENLETVLGFHVVPAVAFAEDLDEGPQTFTTVAGQDITVTRTGAEVTVTDFEGNVSNVITPDVAIANGVVHVIDAVLLPELPEVLPNLVEAATDAGLTTLLAAVEAVEDLDETLLGLDAITVFAPDNDAFDDALNAFGADNLEELVAAIGGIGNLEIVLGFHVVPAVAFADDLNEGPQTFTTVAGQDITVTRTGSDVTVTDFEGNVSNVIIPDVAIENGVVHVIDAVLLPELPEEQNTVGMTVGNDGASAYFVSEIVGDENVTELNENNSTWTLTVGTRYELNVTGFGPHPFEIRDASGNALLSMSASGSFENNSNVNFQTSDAQFSFTLTQELADEIADYVCTVHGSMRGDIVVQ
jgi:uncharacterized surface protein with fasciclin (FAS1) repeats